MHRSTRFWDRIAERYSKRPIADEAAYERKLQVTREHLRPDMEVLEFGCGTGSTALLHAPHVKHLHAIDISGKMLEIARGKAEAERVENVTFTQASIDEFSAADQSFDAVLGLSILHLLERRDAVIAKVYRMLKPGGVFVSSTLCLAETTRLLKLVAPMGRWLGLMPPLRVFTAKDLTDALTGAGFEIDFRWQPAKGSALFLVAKKA